jgi:hypothetical protein
MDLFTKFGLSKECELSEPECAAQTSCAPDRLVEENKPGSMVYYYEG